MSEALDKHLDLHSSPQLTQLTMNGVSCLLLGPQMSDLVWVHCTVCSLLPCWRKAAARKYEVWWSSRPHRMAFLARSEPKAVVEPFGPTLDIVSSWLDMQQRGTAQKSPLSHSKLTSSLKLTAPQNWISISRPYRTERNRTQRILWCCENTCLRIVQNSDPRYLSSSLRYLRDIMHCNQDGRASMPLDLRW
jgi:hypothetical protein